MRVHLGSDHAGYELKNHLVAWLTAAGHEPVPPSISACRAAVSAGDTAPVPGGSTPDRSSPVHAPVRQHCPACPTNLLPSAATDGLRVASVV